MLTLATPLKSLEKNVKKVLELLEIIIQVWLIAGSQLAKGDLQSMFLKRICDTKEKSKASIAFQFLHNEEYY
ncbi:hypothetical protein PM01_08745 [Sulfitobacter pontiacus 3SOLIMAR09]|nr:hypothetical protein PM01_08745 [Sulfitobacter pontiacus 3SOLIMAR09]